MHRSSRQMRKIPVIENKLVRNLRQQGWFGIVFANIQNFVFKRNKSLVFKNEGYYYSTSENVESKWN